MGRKSKPYWEAKRNTWCCVIKGTKHRLGANKREAEKEFHRLMGETSSSNSPLSVAEVAEQFLAWTSENRSPHTLRHQQHFVVSFLMANPKLPYSLLTPAHVTRWVSNKSWSSTTKNDAIGVIVRMASWAKTNLGLPSTIAGIERPSRKSRASRVSLIDFKLALRNIPDRNFRELLLFCWDCGVRPKEANGLQPRHVDLERSRCVIPTSEAKGKQKARVIYLATKRAVTLVKKGMDREYIFINTEGRQWTNDAVKCAFKRLKIKTGLHLTQYSFRHTYITRMIENGVDSHVIAQLAGHVDTAMIDRVYSHVAQNDEFMLSQAKRIKQPQQGGT